MRAVGHRAIGLLAALTGLAPGAWGQGPQPNQRDDKNQYTLFHPTPPHLLRELTTDRPDKTETPFTVDAGHFQVEMDLFSYSRDRHNPERADLLHEQWTVGPMSLKIGLLNRLDFQMVVTPYREERIEDNTPSPRKVVRNSGFGDVVLRAKVNVWGNDGGATALGLLPLLKLPTSSEALGNEAVEGGVVVPFEIGLPLGMSLGFNGGWFWARDEASAGYHSEWLASVAWGYPIAARVTGYVEFWSQLDAETPSAWKGSFDFGFNYLVSRNLKLDVGLNIGVTRAADDWNPFLGLSWRF
jgi:hypothetical protein